MGDAQVVLHQLASRSMHDAYAGAILREACVMLESLSRVRFVYTHREANRVMHFVAQQALRYPGIHSVLHDFSFFV
ncbi:unnamed protein product [Linum trigynum]|uniref:RNase H type-1 domain-containing protein n=1 Tax=Linum trigynum TaxID=586398 RepID=A0AAV2EFE7_9ROSI